MMQLKQSSGCEGFVPSICAQIITPDWDSLELIQIIRMKTLTSWFQDLIRILTHTFSLFFETNKYFIEKKARVQSTQEYQEFLIRLTEFTQTCKVSLNAENPSKENLVQIIKALEKQVITILEKGVDTCFKGSRILGQPNVHLEHISWLFKMLASIKVKLI